MWSSDPHPRGDCDKAHITHRHEVTILRDVFINPLVLGCSLEKVHFGTAVVTLIGQKRRKYGIEQDRIRVSAARPNNFPA